MNINKNYTEKGFPGEVTFVFRSEGMSQEFSRVARIGRTFREGHMFCAVSVEKDSTYQNSFIFSSGGWINYVDILFGVPGASRKVDK